jgi:hypothetical protein
MKMVWDKVIAHLRRWCILCSPTLSDIMERNLLELERTRGELLRIAWRDV